MFQVPPKSLVAVPEHAPPAEDAYPSYEELRESPELRFFVASAEGLRADCHALYARLPDELCRARAAMPLRHREHEGMRVRIASPKTWHYLVSVEPRDPLADPEIPTEVPGIMIARKQAEVLQIPGEVPKLRGRDVFVPAPGCEEEFAAYFDRPVTPHDHVAWPFGEQDTEAAKAVSRLLYECVPDRRAIRAERRRVRERR